MFNLLRMDLYRLKRSKSVYISFAILMAMTLLSYWMLWMATTPQGRAHAEKIGVVFTTEDQSELQVIDDCDSLMLFREIGMDGGAYSSILGILTAVFVCLDFHSGFVKNTLSLHPSRWKYIAAKIMAAGILNVFLLTLQFLFCSLMNIVWGHLVPFAALKDILPYMANAWLITTAFSAMIVLVCMLTRNTSVGVMAALLLGSGLVHLLLYQFASLFKLTGWYEYTLYYNMTFAPSAFSSLADWKGAGIALVYLVLYAVFSAVALAKRDI